MYDLSYRFVAPAFRFRALLLLALGVVVVGCKSAPAPQDDGALLQAVQNKLSSDTALASEPIRTSVQQAIVTLDGTVSSDAARSLAANDVAQVAGIKTVVNNLTVVALAPAAVASVAPPPVRAPRATSSKSAAPAPSPRPPSTRLRHPYPATPLPAPTDQVDEASASAPAPIERNLPDNTPPPAPPLARTESRSITLPADTTFSVRITQTLDSATAEEGATFSGVLASDILSDGIVVLPQGTGVSGRVTAVQEAGHYKGNSLLSIELISLNRKGDHLPLTTDTFSKAGNGRGKNSAAKIGGGAAVGAILGGILGGGKGAAIGAAAGGGAGAGVQAVTRGQQVQIESESLVSFHLASPITVRLSPNGQEPKRQSDPDLQRHP